MIFLLMYIILGPCEYIIHVYFTMMMTHRSVFLKENHDYTIVLSLVNNQVLYESFSFVSKKMYILCT